ncbi:MAG TPA: class IV adenylate cyclase [Candidatus Angelobacter sp.]|nr:class IV adenylate cyclase [Candidatus Angelobacter sp.]
MYRKAGYTAPCMVNHEVEIKSRIASLSDLNRRLRAAGLKLVTRRTHERNTLYDFPDEALRRRGSILRLRQYGPKWTLTYKDKGKTGRHKKRREIETQVTDGKALEQIVEAVGFRPVFSYEKFRTEWGDDTGHVVVDETPIGNFCEIEGPPRWIDRMARQLEIPPQDYITESYPELFRHWKLQTKSKARDMLFAAASRSSGKKAGKP